MIDHRRMFHIGLRVDDLDEAMAEVGPPLGLTWACPREVEQPVWTPTGGAELVAIRFTYSVEGDQHLELVQGPPGSVWAVDDGAGVHHFGVWVDDVASEAGSLLEAGWAVVAAHHSPDAGFGRFAYLAPPSGLVVELVDEAVRPHFEAWWSGAA